MCSENPDVHKDVEAFQEFVDGMDDVNLPLYYLYYFEFKGNTIPPMGRFSLDKNIAGEAMRSIQKFYIQEEHTFFGDSIKSNEISIVYRMQSERYEIIDIEELIITEVKPWLD